jgi:putative membrane protein
MLWGSIMMVVFWGGIIGLIVWAVQAATRRDHHHEETIVRPSVARPDDIAKERYARGEIGREEFERIIGDLERPPPSKVRV